jgi:hypothetical protein
MRLKEVAAIASALTHAPAELQAFRVYVVDTSFFALLFPHRQRPAILAIEVECHA